MTLVYSFVLTLQEICGGFQICVWACTTSHFVGFDMDIETLSRFLIPCYQLQLIYCDNS